MDPLALAMPITSLVRPPLSVPDFFLITDAGPLRLGFAIYNSRGVLLWYSSYTWPFVRNDNFQNAKEFLAFLVALIDLLTSDVVSDSCTIQWTGDNTSSLSWVRERREM